MKYRSPVVHKFLPAVNSVNAQAQYVVTLDPDFCQGTVCAGIERHYELNEPSLACFHSAPEPGTLVTITCEGIDGSFTLIVESVTSNPSQNGECTGTESAFDLITSSPDLTSDCLVTSFTVGGENLCDHACDG